MYIKDTLGYYSPTIFNSSMVNEKTVSLGINNKRSPPPPMKKIKSGENISEADTVGDPLRPTNKNF